MTVIRTHASFWTTGFLVYGDSNYIRDGLGYVVARSFAYELENDRIFRPIIERNLFDIPVAVIYNGRRYAIEEIVNGMKRWTDYCVDEYQYRMLLEFLTCFVHLDTMYWDKGYKFPCVWDHRQPFVLQIGSMMDFLVQWPSTEYVIDVDAPSVGTFVLDDISSITEHVLVTEFFPAWEVLDDVDESFRCEQCEEETKEE